MNGRSKGYESIYTKLRTGLLVASEPSLLGHMIKWVMTQTSHPKMEQTNP